jgi:hypothetical protein
MRRNQVQGRLTEQELALPIARYIEDWNCMAERVGAEKADLGALTDRARRGLIAIVKRNKWLSAFAQIEESAWARGKLKRDWTFVWILENHRVLWRFGG